MSLHENEVFAEHQAEMDTCLVVKRIDGKVTVVRRVGISRQEAYDVARTLFPGQKVHGIMPPAMPYEGVEIRSAEYWPDYWDMYGPPKSLDEHNELFNS